MTHTRNLLLSRHALVLAAVARAPTMEIREISEALNLGDRTVHRFLNDLAEAGYLTRHKAGWSRRYEVHRDAPVGEFGAIATTVGALVDAINASR